MFDKYIEKYMPVDTRRTSIEYDCMLGTTGNSGHGGGTYKCTEAHDQNGYYVHIPNNGSDLVTKNNIGTRKLIVYNEDQTVRASYEGPARHGGKSKKSRKSRKSNKSKKSRKSNKSRKSRK